MICRLGIKFCLLLDNLGKKGRGDLFWAPTGLTWEREHPPGAKLLFSSFRASPSYLNRDGRRWIRRRRINRRLTISTRNKYVITMPLRKRKNMAGSGVNPKTLANGETGSTIPSRTINIVVIANGRLGRLRNGLPAVRITKSTSVCVASDSTNQPV